MNAEFCPAEFWTNRDPGDETNHVGASGSYVTESMEGGRDVTAKLEQFDKEADSAYEDLLSWMKTNREALLAMARGRHAWGHFRYRDKLMFEYDYDQLTAEAAEEVADAINYFARRRVRGQS